MIRGILPDGLGFFFVFSVAVLQLIGFTLRRHAPRHTSPSLTRRSFSLSALPSPLILPSYHARCTIPRSKHYETAGCCRAGARVKLGPLELELELELEGLLGWLFRLFVCVSLRLPRASVQRLT